MHPRPPLEASCLTAADRDDRWRQFPQTRPGKRGWWPSERHLDRLRHLRHSAALSCFRRLVHAAEPRRSWRRPKLCSAGRQDHRAQHRHPERRLSWRTAARSAPPKSARPSAASSASPHRRRTPISALKSGCRRPANGTANSAAKAPAAARARSRLAPCATRCTPAMPPCPPTMAMSTDANDPWAAADRAGPIRPSAEDDRLGLAGAASLHRRRQTGGARISTAGRRERTISSPARPAAITP